MDGEGKIRRCRGNEMEKYAKGNRGSERERTGDVGGRIRRNLRRERGGGNGKGQEM